MNHFYLKEVFVIASNSAADCRQYMPMICFSAGNKKHEISTYANEGIMFRYETKDGMEIYEFQVTLKQKELSFRAAIALVTVVMMLNQMPWKKRMPRSR